MEDVLFLIPARSGSKGVQDKNIKELFGIPLLAIRGLSALKLTAAEHIWLSTDSEHYAEIGRKYNITVPFIRPSNLADDTSTSADVVLHAMNFADQQGYAYKMVALLEPTSPFVYSAYLQEAIAELSANKDASAIVATKEVEVASTFIQPQSKYLDVLAENLRKAKTMRRQDFKNEITPAGGFYIAKWDHFLTHKTFYTDNTLSYLLPTENALEIDHMIQFHWAEYMVEKAIIDIKKII